MSNSQLAAAAAGGLVVLLATVDLFLTVFNYDGFTFAAGRFQRACWRVVLLATAALPPSARQAARSLGSASLLPATVALWLGAQIAGFALIYWAGLQSGGFHLAANLTRGIGTAFYLSGGDESSLTFGDVVPHQGIYRALVDLQTIVGLATFTLALGYVVTTFGILSDLAGLHNTVRRHARHPGRPTSILARHYRGGEPSELPDLLQTLSERLESYDEGLRRYPVVYYFHTRRPSRSIPQIFAALAELLADIRWGLPADDRMIEDPWLAALLEQYAATIGRLQTSFVGPEHFESPVPASAETFRVAYHSGRGGSDFSIADFRQLQSRTRLATGHSPPPDPDSGAAYQRYLEWLPFHRRTQIILERVASHLGYDVRNMAVRP